MSYNAIMLQGTGSHVGKSVLTAALCRILKQDGFSVAPFKSQNMALNSFVTKAGGEMGRAQVVQAEAAGVEPDVRMNPILLKPTGNSTSQVIVLGKPIGNMNAREYHADWTLRALGIIEEAFTYLTKHYQCIVIEGAGSPAEINLKDTEIVNMRVAKLTKAPVVLIGDIDRGGVLASLVGTLALLDEDERQLIKGFIINKFRGDVSLFQPAVEFLEARTGIPVLGVIPYFTGFKVQEEDSVAHDQLGRQGLERDMSKVDIAVIRLPFISNFTDFDCFEAEGDVQLRYVTQGQKLGPADLVIIPGSKNTIQDLLYLKNSGLAQEILEHAALGKPVIGICGGYQMLGKLVKDPLQTESDLPEIEGLGLLDTETIFAPEKTTCQVEGVLLDDGTAVVTGYEIHMGTTTLGAQAKPSLRLLTRSGQPVEAFDGAINDTGSVWGTYLHGIFDNDSFRRKLINQLRLEKGLEPISAQLGKSIVEQREEDYDKLADFVRQHLDMEKVYEIMQLNRGGCHEPSRSLSR